MDNFLVNRIPYNRKMHFRKNKLFSFFALSLALSLYLYVGWFTARLLRRWRGSAHRKTPVRQRHRALGVSFRFTITRIACNCRGPTWPAAFNFASSRRVNCPIDLRGGEREPEVIARAIAAVAPSAIIILAWSYARVAADVDCTSGNPSGSLLFRLLRIN